MNNSLTHPFASLNALADEQQKFFAQGFTRSYAFRKGQLRVLRAAVLRYEEKITAALKKDLGKSDFEIYGTEIGPILKEISFASKHLRGWMKPKYKPTPLLFFPSSSKIIYEPRGTCLIIGPFNYPFMLLMVPLISAIAAGNTVILKPSEQPTETERVIAEMINETYEPEYIAVVCGSGKQLSEELIAKRQLGLVFFTGSTQTGKAIMQAAAQQLTPVVLELGGKSPVIVADDAPLSYAAKKILFSKTINAGQSCVAADYVLVHASRKKDLIAALKKEMLKMFGSDYKNNPEYGRMISRQRTEKMLDYVPGSNTGADISERFIELAIVDLPNEDELTDDEIFGPVLPIVSFNSYEEAKQIIQRFPNPLSLYLFTGNKQTEKFFIEGISFGGGCINNTIIHLGNPNLPFNGIGNSGIGQNHGYYGFLAFSHTKSIMKSSPLFDVPVWYPPHPKWHTNLLRKILK